METLSFFDFIAGLLIPFIVRMYEKKFPDRPLLKYGTVLAICAFTGLVIAQVEGMLNFANVFQSMVVVATISQTVYVAAFKGLKKPIK